MKRSLALAIAFGLVAVPAFAGPNSLQPTDRQVLAAVAEVENGKGDTGWPGFNPSTLPIALVDRGRVAILINPTRPPKGFTALSAPGFSRYIWVKWGANPDLEKVRDFKGFFNGESVTVLPYPYLLYDRHPEPRQIVTPLFSTYEQQAFADYPTYRSATVAEGQYPTADAANTARANLENQILAIALQFKDPDRLRDYGRMLVAVRKARHAKLDPAIARYESLTETFEGCLRYVESRLGTPAAKEAAVRSLVGRLGVPLDSEATRRARLSAVGAGLATMLDRMEDENWKGQVTSGAGLVDALARAVGYRDAEGPGLVRSAEQVFGYNQLLSQAKDAWSRYPSSYKDFMERPGTRWTIQGLQRVSEGDDPAKSGKDGLRVMSMAPPVEIDAHTLLANRLDAFRYRRGGVWVQVKDLPMLMHSNSLAWPFEALTFVSGDALALTVDGQAIALKNGTYTAKKSLKLSGPHADLAAGAGTVRVNGRDVTVDLKR